MLKKLRSLLALLGAPPGAARRRPRHRFVPGLELLEARDAPCTFIAAASCPDPKNCTDPGSHALGMHAVTASCPDPKNCTPPELHALAVQAVTANGFHGGLLGL
jgi:hypothetical protein